MTPELHLLQSCEASSAWNEGDKNGGIPGVVMVNEMQFGFMYVKEQLILFLC